MSQWYNGITYKILFFECEPIWRIQNFEKTHRIEIVLRIWS